MRKRIIIGVAVLAVGLGGYVAYELREPQLRTVEYHKRQLLKEPGAIYKFVAEHLPSAMAVPLTKRYNQRELFHQNALIKLGYLERRVFVLSNAWGSSVLERLSVTNIPFAMSEIHHVGSTTIAALRLSEIYDVGSTTIAVLGPTNEMPVWEALIRQLDVPENE